MTFKFRALFTIFLLGTLMSCSLLNNLKLKPETITSAVVAHSTFPSLAMQVQECVAEHPEVRDQIVDPFNSLVDLWHSASKLKADATLLVDLVNAKAEVVAGKDSWLTIKSVIVGAGIDCGPAVKAQVARIENIFTELESSILSNERAVYALEWVDLLSSVVLGRRGEVIRMSVPS